MSVTEMGQTRGRMRISRGLKLWVLILAIGLVSGVVGVIKDGWDIGASIGSFVWAALATCVGVLIWRENKSKRTDDSGGDNAGRN
jgi:hypothetical protein